MLLLCLGLFVFAFTVFGVIKGFNTTIVLLLSGLALWTLAFAFDANYYTIEGFKDSNHTFIDICSMFVMITKQNLAGVGLIIMFVGGFASYMNGIGASNAFVQVASKPLMIIKNPYILVAMTVVFAQIMSIFVTSATGLAMLLLVTLFPLLRKLNVSAASAAAAMASAACLEFGPASGTTNVAADYSNMTAMQYFMDYQLITGAASTIVIAALYFITSIYFDKKEHAQAVAEDSSIISTSPESDEGNRLPALYALLPALPLIILLFSGSVISGVEISVVEAMFMSFLVTLFCELLRTRNLKETFENATTFLKGMGDMLKGVVMLLIAAQFFAAGLQGVGVSYYLIEAANAAGFGVIGMTIMLILVIAALTVVSGSGNAAFLGFVGLAQSIALKMGAAPVQVILPMHAASGLFRSMSPVAGLVIAVAGSTGVDPFRIVKRTIIPMLGGVITSLIVANLL